MRAFFVIFAAGYALGEELLQPSAEQSEAFAVLGGIVDHLVLLTATFAAGRPDRIQNFREAFLLFELLQSVFHVAEALRVSALLPDEDLRAWLAAEVVDFRGRLDAFLEPGAELLVDLVGAPDEATRDVRERFQ